MPISNIKDQPQRNSPQKFGASLDTYMGDSLETVAVGLSALYFVLTASHILLLPASFSYILASVSLTTALALASLKVALKGRVIPERWVHPLGTGIAAVVLINSLLHLHLVPDPKHTVNLMLLIIGIGCLFRSVKWFALNIAATLTGWIFIALPNVDLPDWVHYAFSIFMATALSIIVFTVRSRIYRNLSQVIEAARKSEEVLRESEARYRDLVENSEGLICTHDLQGNILSTNLAASRALGYRTEELVGRNIREGLIPSTQSLFDDYLDKIRRDKKHSGLMALRAKDGTERIWIYRNSLYEQPDGTAYILGHAQDITERTQLESLLRAQNQILKMLLSGMSLEDLLNNICRLVEKHSTVRMCSVLVRKEPSGNMVFAAYPQISESFIKGIQTVEMHAETDISGLRGFDVMRDERFSACRDEALKQGVKSCCAIPVVSSKGKCLGKFIIWFEKGGATPSSWDSKVFQSASRLTSLALENKHMEESLLEAYETLEDRVLQRTRELEQANETLKREILERQQKEEALRASERRFYKLFHFNPLPMTISVIDSGRIIDINESALRDYGFTREEVKGHTALDIGLWKDPGCREKLIRSLERGQPVNSMEVELVNKSGETGISLVSAHMIEVDGQQCLLLAMSDVTDHKKAEEAIRENEEKYRVLYEDNPSMYFTLDAQGTVLSVNRFGVEQLGYEKGELVGQSVLNVFHPDDKGAVRRNLEKCIESPEKSSEWEFRKVRKDGSVIWVREQVRVLRRHQGDTIVLVVCEDITEHKEAKNNLNRQNDYLAALHETTLGLMNRLNLEELLQDIVSRACSLVHIPNGFIYLVEPDGTKLTVRVAIGSSHRLVGKSISPGEGVPGKVWQTGEPFVVNDYRNWPDRITEKGYDALHAVAGVPLKSGTEIIGVLGIESPDETTKFGESEIEILSRLAQLASVALDNTTLYNSLQEKLVELSDLEATVRKSAIEWRDTFDTIESPVIITDLSGGIIRLNKAADELLKRNNKDISPLSIGAVAAGEPWRKAEELVLTVGETRTGESAQARDSKTGRTWDITANLLLMPEFREDRIILVAREITSLVRLQESLRKSELVFAMGQLVAGVAHEVRNPLFGISATLDAFEQILNLNDDFFQSGTGGLEMQSKYFNYISALRDGVDRLNSLMEELLEYGKPTVLEYSHCRLSDILAESLKISGPVPTQIKIDVQVSLEQKLVSIDRKRMVLAFRNLIDNAIQHSPTDSSITISAEEISCEDGSWIECRVEDCGPGFNTDDLQRIFDPFFTRRRGGTGLGLSIVQRIVEEHKGKIFAANRPDGGAVITIHIPVNE